jgi:hypothetical protein
MKMFLNIKCFDVQFAFNHTKFNCFRDGLLHFGNQNRNSHLLIHRLAWHSTINKGKFPQKDIHNSENQTALFILKSW